MKRFIAAAATTAFVAGGLGLTGVAVAGPAQAKPLPPHTWCPGNNMNYSRYDMGSGPGVAYQWDMNVCHTWYWTNGQGNVPWNGRFPSDVWDGPGGPGPKEDSCDFCW